MGIDRDQETAQLGIFAAQSRVPPGCALETVTEGVWPHHFQGPSNFSLSINNIGIRKVGEEKNMVFVVTMTWSVDKTPEIAKRAAAEAKKPPAKGVKTIAEYVVLGQCKMVEIVDVPDENAIFAIHMPFMDIAECDWAPAMSGESILKSLGM